MNSHELARKWIDVAERLLDKPAFALPDYEDGERSINYFSDKKEFLNAIRSLGSGEKDLSDLNYMKFRPFSGLYIAVNRETVCRKVQEVKWECEPLFSPEEQAVFDAAPADDGVPF